MIKSLYVNDRPGNGSAFVSLAEVRDIAARIDTTDAWRVYDACARVCIDAVGTDALSLYRVDTQDKTNERKR